MFAEILLLTALVAGLAWVHRLAFVQPDARVLGVTLFFDLVVSVLVVAAVANRPLYVAWMQEDNWAEWATFFAFLGAGIAAAAALRLAFGTPIVPQITGPRWLSVGAALGLMGFCFFVAGEEISWAQRLLAFKPPDFFLERNFQQELNLHNLLKGEKLLGFRLESRNLIAVIAIGYGVLAPLGFRFLKPEGRLGQPALWLPPLSLAPWFGAVAAAELTYKVDYTGEAAELVFGLLFLADGLLRLDRWGTSRGQFGFKRLLMLLVIPLLLGVAAVPVTALIIYGSDEESAALAGRELDLLRRDFGHKDNVARWLFRKSSIHKRLFSAVRKGYFHFGKRASFLDHRRSPAEAQGAEARRDRHGYFLDPWNNPYWIRYERGGGRAVIYSFGPNRRRDSDLKPIGKMSGDDIGVFFELKRSR